MYCTTSSGIPDGFCSPGYYCVQGASTATPNGTVNAFGVTGNVCPAGHYCPAGTVVPVACPAGRFSSQAGNTNVTDCIPCSSGAYCPDVGTVLPLHSCTGGFYCPAGTSFPTLLCPNATMCPVGSSAPLPCPAGSYQSRTGQQACDDCPATKYCVESVDAPASCPPGHYCPVRTEFSTQYPCPRGRFSSSGNLSASSQCSLCTPGYYCFEEGLTAPSGECDEGHYCLGGAVVPAPTEGFDNGFSCVLNSTNVSGGAPVTGDLCPPGFYCPQGSSSPQPCPAGTFSPNYGNGNISQCVPCSPGFVCGGTGTVTPSVLCSAGYYCPGGQSATSEHVCPSGSYCVAGVAHPTACSAGEYQSAIGQDRCDVCPARFVCAANTTTPSTCPPGYVCPAGTGNATQYPCPIGKYSNVGGLADATECVSCPAGQYCETPGLTAPTGNCSAGFYCVRNASEPSPTGLLTGDECPPGSYCPSGSTGPISCSVGRYQPAFRAASVADCLNCTIGHFCPSNSTVAPTPCSPGYYCPLNQVTPTLTCTLGSYCPGGDGTPIPCPPGQYQNQTGQSTCKTCPQSHFCSGGTIVPSPCPVGHYCPTGTSVGTQFPCPNGTFNNGTQLASAEDCTPCLAGFVCDVPGIVLPTLLCGPGHYCSRGAWVTQPSDGGITGGPCDPGFVCFGGSPVPNPSGVGPTASAGRPCSPGTYCPSGSSVEIGCPAGTYNPTPGASSCSPCPGGSMCTGNTAVPSPCPLQYFCPPSTSVPLPCPDGTFGNGTSLQNATQCTTCPAGVFCTNGAVSGPCAAGHACYYGVGVPAPENDDGTLSPPGGSRRGLCLYESVVFPERALVRCVMQKRAQLGFSAHRARPSLSLVRTARSLLPCVQLPTQHVVIVLRYGIRRLLLRVAPRLSCCSLLALFRRAQGYLCTIGSPILRPCPQGSYCPGSGVRIECPPSTYNPDNGSHASLDCRMCPAGYLCDTEGTVDYLPYACPPGRYCLEKVSGLCLRLSLCKVVVGQ
jgi:hypothetical protein